MNAVARRLILSLTPLVAALPVSAQGAPSKPGPPQRSSTPYALRLSAEIRGESRCPLTSPAEIMVGPADETVVLDPPQRHACVFGADGRLRRTIGAAGTGAGQVEWPASAHMRPEGLWLVDKDQRRFVLYGLDGTALRTILSSVNATTAIPIADRRIAIEVTQPGSMSPTNVLAITTPVGTPMDTFAKYTPATGGIDLEFRRRGGGNPLTTYFPFASDPIWLAASNGKSLYVITRIVPTKFAPPISAKQANAPPAERTVTIEKFDSSNGRRVWLRSYAYKPIPVTSAMSNRIMEEWVTRIAAATGATRAQVSRDRVRYNTHIPKTLPPVTRAFAGSDNALWLRIAAADDANVTWMVVEGNGNVTKTVADAPDATIMAARGNRVWASAKNAQGKSVIRVYDVEITPPSRDSRE